jgi:hypothetical protein
MNNDIIILLTGLTLSIALWLFFRKIKARMSLHVADLVFEPGDLKDFSSFFTALTGKLGLAGAFSWLISHGKVLCQQLVKHGHVNLLAELCVQEATAKLVFDAVQSAGNTQMYRHLLVKTVTSISMLDHLERELAAAPYLESLLKEDIEAHRKKLLPDIPGASGQIDIDPPGSDPNLPTRNL